MNKMRMCLNWKVIGGLAVVGLGLWAVAPNVVGTALPLLLVLACPLSILFMMRGMGGKQANQCSAQPKATAKVDAREAVAGQPLAELKAKLSALHAQQEVITREISSRVAAPKTARANGSEIRMPAEGNGREASVAEEENLNR